jgi:hypothetical protein
MTASPILKANRPATRHSSLPDTANPPKESSCWPAIIVASGKSGLLVVAALVRSRIQQRELKRNARHATATNCGAFQLALRLPPQIVESLPGVQRLHRRASPENVWENASP